MSILSRLIRLVRDMPAAEARRVAANRLGFVRLVAAACFLAIGSRVLILAADVNAEAQFYTPTQEQVIRGDILDRNGQMMATTLPAFELYANPKEILDPYEAAAALSSVLTDMSEEELFSRLTRQSSYAELAWRLSPKNMLMCFGLA